MKVKSDILDIAQIVLCADLLIHSYSKMTVKDKVRLIRNIERVKELRKKGELV